MSSKQIAACMIYLMVLLVGVSMMVFASIYPSARSEGTFLVASDMLKMSASALIGAASVLMGGHNAGKVVV